MWTTQTSWSIVDELAEFELPDDPSDIDQADEAYFMTLTLEEDREDELDF